MSQRFCLFYAGYCSSAPALYFNQLVLCRQHQLHSGDPDKQEIDSFLKIVEEGHYEQASNLKTAESIAVHFELESPALPEGPEGYFEWHQRYCEIFDNQYPMSRIDHYYFLFGRKISEVLTNLGLARWCLGISFASNQAIDLSKRTEKCIRDTEFILFKLIAPAALLSSEHRHNFFNLYYKKINAEFEPFREMNAESLDVAQMEKLRTDLCSFEEQVVAGFKDCVLRLRELGV